jgi:hypothetical protein
MGAAVARRRREPQRAVDWNFLSFPVAFGFAVGAFIATLLAPVLYGPLFVLSLFGVSFGMAHIFSRWIRTRMQSRAQDRADEEERERRALAARAAAAQQGEAASARRRRRRRG